jgi:flagellar biosynthetic protein FliP
VRAGTGRVPTTLIVAVGVLAMFAALAGAQTATPFYVPDARQMLPAAKDAQGAVSSLQILILLTVLALAPSILILMTSFTRIIIVLALLRQALSTQTLPPNQVLIGLALFMTVMLMTPTWNQIQTKALTPYLNNQLTQEQAFDAAMAPLREFMIRQIETTDNEEDVHMFLSYTDVKTVERWGDVPTTVLIPAFITSELKTAFIIGFRIYLPFLVIDMVISSILISMGMMMLPPTLISLPIKLLLFVLVDGWHLVTSGLMDSFM